VKGNPLLIPAEPIGDAWEPTEPTEAGILSNSKTWDAVDLFRAEIPLPEGLLAGRALVRQTVNLLLGEGGSGKSWIALALARCAVLSQKLGHLDVTPGRVLFLSEEMTDGDIRDRVRDLFTEAELASIPGRFRIRCRSGIAADTKPGLEALRRLIEEEGCPDYVFIDSLVDIHSKDENSNSEMGPVFRGLRDLVATPTNSAVTVIHHAGKPGEFLKGSNRSRGASVIRDICSDVILVECKAEDGPRTIKFAKCRHGGSRAPKTFTLEMVPGEPGGPPVTFSISTGEGEQEGTILKQVRIVVAALQKLGGEAIRADLRDALSASEKWSRETSYRHIRQSEELGMITIDDSIAPHVLRVS
jgi:hypothetical protein